MESRKNFSCQYHLGSLNVVNPKAFLVVKTDAADIEYWGGRRGGGGGEGSQTENSRSRTIGSMPFWNKDWCTKEKLYCQIKKDKKKKKESLSMVLCIAKVQGNLINETFLVVAYCKSSKVVLQKDAKNLISKQILSR